MQIGLKWLPNKLFQTQLLHFTNFLIRMPLAEGVKAPEFSLPNEKGELVQLSDFQGKKLVIYFYPQDDTPTCTKQACNLRDNLPALQQAGYTVLGVSMDGPQKHRKFISKYGLNFSLLADENREMIDAFDVWKEKKTFGRTYMGIVRTTYLIGENGMIERVIESVDSGDHANQILK